MFYKNSILVFLLIINSGCEDLIKKAPIDKPPTKKVEENSVSENKDNPSACQSKDKKICKYGFLEAACGELVVNFHKNWSTHQPIESFPSLKELIEKEGAVIRSVDKELGFMLVCYNLNPEKLDSKKKQLEKHPAVNFISYNALSRPDVE